MFGKYNTIKIYFNVSLALMVFLSVYWWALAIVILFMVGACLSGFREVHGIGNFDIWWIKCQLKLMLAGITMISGITIGALLEKRAKNFNSVAVESIYKTHN